MKKRHPANLVVAILCLATTIYFLVTGFSHADAALESTQEWYIAVVIMSAIPFFACGVSLIAWLKRW